MPLVAYVLTYVYEAGYCKFFGLPWEFISPNWTSVFIATGALLGLAMVLFVLVEPLFIIFGSSVVSGPIRRRLSRLSVVMLFCLTSTILFVRYWGYWIAPFLLLFFFAFLEFVLPLATQRGKGTYVEKLEAQDAVDDRLESLTDVAAKRLGLSAFTVLFLVFVLVVISYDAGLGAAMKQENFMVLEDTPDSVVLRIYGDRIIAAEFDRETKVVSRRFKIVSVDGTALRLEKVGPLKDEAP
ncbi:MAG: hypothetical protein A3H28_08665 [Acidobacteria bacterium RIFCSPLOWO2_02_FULL_61_28]|nr:MAG: hypothetical protein A3H28_08665 [Acidobacteria bacterium RIFCSPLOWO2_02_FULL_61_28]